MLSCIEFFVEEYLCCEGYDLQKFCYVYFDGMFYIDVDGFVCIVWLVVFLVYQDVYVLFDVENELQVFGCDVVGCLQYCYYFDFVQVGVLKKW